MKISIEHQERKVTEVEITFPHYRTNGYHFYKVLSPSKVISVFPSEWNPNVNTVHLELAFSENSKETTEEEFDQAFNTAIDFLKNLEVQNHEQAV